MIILSVSLVNPSIMAQDRLSNYAGTLNTDNSTDGFPSLQSVGCPGPQNIAALREQLMLPIDPSNENALYSCLSVAKRLATSADIFFKDQVDRLDRYFRVRQTLSMCQMPDNGLAQIILQRAAEVQVGDIKKGSNWVDRLGKSKVTGSGDAPLLSLIQDRVIVQASVNALDHYNLFNYKYDLPKGNAVDRLCQGDCSKEAKDAMTERQSLWSKNEDIFEKPNFEQIKKQLNEDMQPAIDAASAFNNSLEAHSKEKRGFESIHYKPRNPETSEKLYSEYQSKYWQTIGSEHGLLLATNSLNLRLKMPSPQMPSGGVAAEMLLNDHFSRRSNVGPNHKVDYVENIESIRKAARDGIQLMEKQMGFLNEMQSNKKSLEKSGKALNRTEYIKDLVRLARTNPMAVAQVLMADPSLAGSFCAIISSSKSMRESDEVFKQKWGKVFLFGGIVLGVGAAALSLTGVGTPMGIALMGVAGSVMGVASGGMDGLEALRARRLSQEHKSAAFSGSDSARGIREGQLEYDKFQSQALKSAVTIGASFAGFLSQGSKLVNLAQLRRSQQAMSAAEKLAEKGVDIKALGNADPAAAERVVLSGDAGLADDLSAMATKDPKGLRSILDQVGKVCGLKK